VTIEDVNISEALFGPDIGGNKGKTTRSKPIQLFQIILRFCQMFMPKLMLQVLVMDSTKKLNYFPPRGEHHTSTAQG
jgi:hypothetical protein